MKDPTFDLPTAHRWFAASLNNQAWDLLETPTRSAEQNELMRNTAHAAARHWWDVGDTIHRQRAECLLAQVHAALAEPAAAMHHALRSLELMVDAGSSIESIDRVFTHDAAARACHLDNQTEETDRHRAEAESARNSITDPTDRRIATDWLGRV